MEPKGDSSPPAPEAAGSATTKPTMVEHIPVAQPNASAPPMPSQPPEAFNPAVTPVSLPEPAKAEPAAPTPTAQQPKNKSTSSPKPKEREASRSLPIVPIVVAIAVAIGLAITAYAAFKNH